jgi:hypothetical protein
MGTAQPKGDVFEEVSKDSRHTLNEYVNPTKAKLSLDAGFIK